MTCIYEIFQDNSVSPCDVTFFNDILAICCLFKGIKQPIVMLDLIKTAVKEDPNLPAIKIITYSLALPAKDRTHPEVIKLKSELVELILRTNQLHIMFTVAATAEILTNKNEFMATFEKVCSLPTSKLFIENQSQQIH